MLTPAEWGMCPVSARTVTPIRRAPIRHPDDQGGTRCPAT